MSKPLSKALAGFVLVVLASASPIVAGDGAILLNQAIAVAGLGTSDPPGWPIEIEEPGLYRLVGNLDQIGLTSDLAAIEILADDVTLDLNGFAVLGGCQPGPCSLGAASLIEGRTAARVRIFDGHLAFARATAVWLGDEARVENLGIFRSSAAAVICGASCTVEGGILVENGGGGSVGPGSLVVETISYGNGLDGFFTSATDVTFREVVMHGNGRHGIFFLNGGGTLVRSALTGNNGDSANPQYQGSPLLLGSSLCGDDLVCP